MQSFITITIRDETGLRLRVNRDVEISSLLKYKHLDILLHGLKLHGRVFEFFYSTFASREHHAWFVCPFYKASPITAALIRHKLGDVSNVISLDLAQQVNEALSAGMPLCKRKDQACSTCFQIRLGGFRVYSVNSVLNKSCIHVRPSMDKFSAPESFTLDIADTFTRPVPANLIYPMIKVLEDLGIHE
ncbi:hypothetical protein CROQUDRAFT_686970 [Cronartium quercuum f. sp. fusiforme G11]|uniref:RNA-dependent RNA polymerase n=1 Tax=Cronartium quercuum f. sp. fusiforme G11 TaxID=708437 RepID=A0A9P6T6R6_9BASI|nr:hypothetical protein CROQUDRAFT_686970 [Cronartium quercuum f. sp. fusiforme G11]